MTAEADAILAKTARGAGWIIGWRMFTRVMGVASTLFLVRLLAPADFGLVAIAMGFGQAADSLSSLGVEEAVIREKTPTRALYDSAFTINVIRGAATASLMAAVAWPVADFFNDQRLFPVMLALAAGLLVAACENIGIVDFRRDIAFEKEFLLMSVPRAISIVVGIGSAFVLRNYWALVTAILTSVALRMAMTYAIHPFRPRFGLSAWRQIAGFSFWSWLLSLSSLLRDRCDNFVIGRVLDVTQVGIFSVGFEIASLPTTEFVSPLGRACFSTFAAARNSGTAIEISDAFLRVLSSMTLIALPAGFGISLVAAPIVTLAFGSSWLGATVTVQILGVALSVTIMGMISVSLLNAYAVLQKMFWVQMAAVAIRIPLLIVLVARMGLAGAAIGVALATAFEHLLYLGMTLRRLHLTLGGLLSHTWRCLVATTLMTVVLISSGLGWTAAPDDPARVAGRLALAVGVGAVVYASSIAALWIASGRPAGPERDMLDIMARLGRRAAQVMRRQSKVLADAGK